MTPKKLLIYLLATTGIVSTALAGFIAYTVSGNIPSLEQLENPPINKATQVLSQEGELIDHLFIERRVMIPYSQIPKNFINALKATEDRKFDSHWGVDIDRIIKAAIKTVFMGKKEGGSTITQQLARNLFLDQSQTFERKIREAATAANIEATYTKEEILEMYCNTVGFGRGAYGINVAAKVHFNKKPTELTLEECAYLVALLKSPTNYNAKKNYDKAKARRDLVLEIMKNEGYITQSEYFEAVEKEINQSQPNKTRRERDIAPHFVESIRQKYTGDPSLDQFDLYRDGLIINTTLNAQIQRYANEAVDEHLRKLQADFNKSYSWAANQKLLNQIVNEAIRKNPQYKAASQELKKEIESKLRNSSRFIDSVKTSVSTIQVGLVVIEAKTGAILAMVGASPRFIDSTYNYKYTLNHTNQIRRQPGSSFKPFVYAMALKNGYTPTTQVECGPFTYRPDGATQAWTPSVTDADCKDPGSTTSLNDALVSSINTVAARLITSVTNPSEVRQLIEEAGVKSPLSSVPALSLGAGGEVSPIELATAYSIFVNGGRTIEPYYVKTIEDQAGNLIYERKPAPSNDVLDENISQTMVRMMQGVVNFGTAASIRREGFVKVEAAGKTGTTNDNADAWFVGFTPELICGVWVGFDDQRINFNTIGRGGQGGKAAAPIWGKLMKKVYNNPNLAYKKYSFGFATDSTNADQTNIPAIQPVNNNVQTRTNEKPRQQASAPVQKTDATLPKKQGQSVLPALPRR
jgi:penicillin-binding protein 1A